jgi:putative endonuclease
MTVTRARSQLSAPARSLTPGPRTALPPNLAATSRRVSCEANGRFAEWAAALTLILRGYRILARRRRTPFGEIDLIAVRGRRLAFVEVKQRANWASVEASLNQAQTRRLHAAAAHWVQARPYYRDFEQGFDSVFVVPGRWPNYRRDTLQPNVSGRRTALG